MFLRMPSLSSMLNINSAMDKPKHLSGSLTDPERAPRNLGPVLLTRNQAGHHVRIHIAREGRARKDFERFPVISQELQDDLLFPEVLQRWNEGRIPAVGKDDVVNMDEDIFPERWKNILRGVSGLLH